MRPDHAVALAGLVVLMAIVAGCTWIIARHVYMPKIEAVQETPALPIDHGDGSSTMARTVHYKPTTKAPTLPKGGKVIATAEVVVKPDQPVDGDCLPVTVRVDVTDHGTDGLRMSERATGGETLEAVHYAPPVRYALRESRWAAGVAYTDGDYAMSVDYDWPGLRAGVTVGDGVGGVRLLFRF